MSKYYDKSLIDYTNAIKNASDEHNHYANRGELFLEINEYKKAVVDYSKAIELTNSTIPKYLNNRGSAYLMLKNKELACKDFQKAAKMNWQKSLTNLQKHCK